jgi:hypothetical protein
MDPLEFARRRAEERRADMLLDPEELERKRVKELDPQDLAFLKLAIEYHEALLEADKKLDLRKLLDLRKVLAVLNAEEIRRIVAHYSMPASVASFAHCSMHHEAWTSVEKKRKLSWDGLVVPPKFAAFLALFGNFSPQHDAERFGVWELIAEPCETGSKPAAESLQSVPC